MKKWLFVILLLACFCPVFAGEDETRGVDEKRELVYKVDIKDEIGPGIWRLTKRSFDRATDEGADSGTHEHVRGNGGVCRFSA